MEQCIKNSLSLLRDDFIDFLMWDSEGGDPSPFLQTIKSKIDNNEEGYSEIDLNSLMLDLINVINQELATCGYKLLNPLLIEHIIKSQQDSHIVEVIDTTERLDSQLETNTEDIMNKVFKDADIAKNNALSSFKYNLRKFLLYDSGKYVTNDEMLNDNILQYKKELLNKVINFVKSRIDINLQINNPEEILKTYGKYFTNLSTELILRIYTNDRIKFDAFVAYNILTNFNYFVKYFLNDQISIKSGLKLFSNNNVYKLSPNLTNLFWTDAKSDEIDVDKSINSITKLCIDTCRLYRFGQEVPVANLYVNFQSFIDIVCTIKKLIWDDKVHLSIKDLILQLPNNQENIVDLFKILVDSDFAGINLLPSQKDTIYSLYKEIFSRGNESLYTISNNIQNKEINYFDYVVQSFNSITPVLNAYYDKDGLKEMKGSSVSSYQFNFNNKINIINNPQINKSLPKRITIVNDKITIKYNEGSITKIRNRYEYNGDQHLLNKLLLNEFLKVDIDSDLYTLYEENVTNSPIERKNIALKQILDFIFDLAKGVKALEMIKNEKLTDRSDILRITGNKYKINETLRTIDIVPQDKLIVLESLAKAKAILDNVFTGIQDKDSEGNALASSATSRLLGRFKELWYNIKNNEKSPANHLMVILDEALVKGVYTIRDIVYNDLDDSKQLLKCNSRELVEIAVLKDFIKPICNVARSGVGILTEDSNIAILTSVNSDKPNISKMIVNFNHFIKNYLEIDTVEDFLHNSDIIPKLLNLTMVLLGSVYSKLINTIQSDLDKLQESEIWNTNVGARLIYQQSRPDGDDLNKISETGIIYYNELNTLLKLKNINVENLFHDIILETKLQLNDLLHTTFKNNSVFVNQDLLDLNIRYNDLTLSEEFFNKKNSEIIYDLIMNNVKLNVSEFTDLDTNWIDDSGNLIIGKVVKDGNEINLVNYSDLYLLTDGNISNFLKKFQPKLNPLLDKYNLIDHLFRLLFLITTVGTHINHKGKNESARYQALYKRNVSETALVHKFNLGQKNGIPNKYNISVVKDISNFVYNVMGDVSTDKPYDGATFVNPVVVWLENNSLNGEKAGLTKKQFIHFYDDKFATGGIIKTAGFAITNSWMRNSPFLERMFRKMMDIKFDDIDITKNVKYDVRYKENDSYYKIIKIEYIGNNSYKLYKVLTDNNGNLIDEKITEEIFQNLNTLYKIWKNIFKGLDCVGKNGSNKLYEGESSIKNLVKAVNNVEVDGKQVLKDSMIHYVVTEGAIKQGAANINTKQAYYDDKELSYFPINITQAGILLDKEHHSDNSEVSIMTQVMSAIAAKGYTWSKANNVYKALLLLALTGVSKLSDDTSFKNTLVKIIILLLSNGTKSKDGLLYSIMETAISEFNDKNIIIENLILPISNPAIFDKIQSVISSTLTDMAIKLKFSGILSVLTPSHEIIKLYNNKLKNQYSKELFEQLNDNREIIPINKIEIGTVYDVIDETGNIQTICVQAPYLIGNDTYGDPNIQYLGYYDFKKLFKSGYKIFENYKRGRNLKAWNCFFTDLNTKERFSYYDIALVKELCESTDKETRSTIRKRILTEVLNQLENGNSITIVDSNDVKRIITINDLEIQPFEIIMSKIFKEKLGLTENDDVSNLTYESFLDKVNSNLTANGTLDYEIALLSINGKHTYLTSSIPTNAIINEYIEFKFDVNGKYYIDSNDLKRYISNNDIIYTTADGSDIIYTKDIEFYLNNAHYNTISVKNKEMIKSLDSLEGIDNEAFEQWKKYKKISETYKEKIALDLYNSFKKTLEVVAARIPAQSMQSFMAMKVVAYEDFDINTAYVSDHQIWLQGSDFDIDCVTILCYELDNSGKFIGWSPYFNLNYIDTSCKFDYPTGKYLNLIDAYEFISKHKDLYADILATISIDPEDNKIHWNDFEKFVNLINRISELGYFIDPNTIKITLQNLGYVNIPDNIDTFFDLIVGLVNKHNLYNKNQELFSKNFLVYNIIDIIKHPINLQQATTPIDEPVNEAKQIANLSEKHTKLDRANPGNFVTDYEAIESNQVGKDVIGISAVGLKAFFAWTHYVNTELNIGNNPIKTIEFLGRRYHIANVRNEKNKVLLNDVLNSENWDDVVLKLSALLSLATDNAKELCLAKLNADSNMADMYIFGLAIGIDFEVLGKLLMSDIGNIALNMLKGSVISLNVRFKSVYDIIDNLLNDPDKILNKVFSNTKVGENSILQFLGKNLPTILPQISNEKLKQAKSIKVLIDNIIRTLNPKEAKEAVDSIKKILNTNKLNSYFNYILELNIFNHRLKNAINDLSKELGAKPNLVVDAFNILYMGSLELKSLGTLCKMNQGVANKFDDYIKFIFNFENILVNRFKLLNIADADRFHFKITSFMEDTSERELILREYDDKQLIMNPLRIISTVPQYKGYLETVYKKHKILYKGSVSYRSAYSNLNSIKSVLGNSNIGKKFKSALNVINYKLINKYFIENGKYFTINSGYDSNTHEHTNIALGIPSNNALFKEWFETKVIQDITNGIISSDDLTLYQSIKQNYFILLLTPSVYSKTASHSNIISLSLDINMSPKNDMDRLLLEKVQAAFDDLNVYYTVGNTKISLKDLFFWYNLISYDNKVSENSFTKLFEGSYKTNLEYIKYNEFLNLVDWSNEVIELAVDEIVREVALLGSTYTTSDGVIISYNKEKFKHIWMMKSDKEWHSMSDITPTMNVPHILKDTFDISYGGTTYKGLLIDGVYLMLFNELIYPININLDGTPNLDELKEILDNIINCELR